MSETVYYKGKLTPTGKTEAEYCGEGGDIYDHYYKAVVVDNQVFTVEKESIDSCDDIFNATRNQDGTINFEVKYYNGGCSFNEAIEEATSSLSEAKEDLISIIEKEVIDSVSIMLKPHMAGVFAVIREKLNMEQSNE